MWENKSFPKKMRVDQIFILVTFILGALSSVVLLIQDVLKVLPIKRFLKSSFRCISKSCIKREKN